MSASLWHILQFSDALDLQLGSELARDLPVILWEPDRSLLPIRPSFRESERYHLDFGLRIRTFPLMRGYARTPVSGLARTGPRLAERLGRQSPVPEEATLVCTTPYFAPVARRWPGPVVYWITDLMIRYAGARPEALLALDRQMCAAATLVCPASERISLYLHSDARCSLDKIQVLPNAVRASNLLAEPLRSPVPLGGAAAWTKGPVAGVLGNLADNMDWEFIRQLMERVPWLEWMFVGPSRRPVEDARQGEAFDGVRHHPRAHFVGKKPYDELYRYARAFTVAILPYRRREPTFSGSSTRFYEHLAAGHPILATPNVEELLHQEPLLQLVDTAEAAAAALEWLRANKWEDGQRTARWEASQRNTWQVRAQTMRAALARRLAPVLVSSRVPVEALS